MWASVTGNETNQGEDQLMHPMGWVYIVVAVVVIGLWVALPRDEDM